MISEAAVRDALRQVFDPELGLNVVDLGLVYGIRVEDSTVYVEMTLTTPGCPLSGSLPAAAARAVERVPGVARAIVHLVWQPPWTPERIAPAVRQQLGRR